MSDPIPLRPLCFVAMPFGTKPRPEGGGPVDFDAVYRLIIRPAIEDAEMEPLRADEEQLGALIHKPMFERLILSEYVVADLTSGNPNVFYELGIRHAIRPHTTMPIVATDSRLPFDLGPVRALHYELDGPVPADPETARAALAQSLRLARNAVVDSPVFQLVEGFGPPDIERLRTDSFRDRVSYSESVKVQLAAARAADESATQIDEVRGTLGPIQDLEAGVAIDLFLSYRDAGAYESMVSLVDELPITLRRTPLVREQLGFALNRLGRRDEAEKVLVDLIETRGPSSETQGILGRVYKDQWQDAVAAGKSFEASGYLKKAIATYLAGFEFDWRDAYPGINAVTLMELADPPDPRRTDIAPVVVYSARRRVESGQPDYWDHATVFEAAVLANDKDAAFEALESALVAKRVRWEPETTLDNLRLILEARRSRGEVEDWYAEVEQALVAAAKAD